MNDLKVGSGGLSFYKLHWPKSLIVNDMVLLIIKTKHRALEMCRERIVKKVPIQWRKNSPVNHLFDHQPTWITLVPFQVILGHVGSFFVLMGHSGPFWVALGCCGLIWVIMDCCGSFGLFSLILYVSRTALLFLGYKAVK